ncbi:hypothetical protein STTU_3318 [Streptomyces sp. Tu6071]|uniref:DUF6284 family protein n=1 Tax=Streptomyces sp. Tu6071 TaxID=355249 RepID=UPI00020E59E9|nr:DUF6284 family protein [Streptomyces sp. Tu6071]EGJ76109.1 hypothetical protein STTU_3318 [Streptomyces sp. Tu6071]
MFIISPIQGNLIPRGTEREPSDAELLAVEAEMPLIEAEVEHLDAYITLLDRVPSEIDMQRLRRTNNRVLAVRRDLANAAARRPAGGAA